MNLQLPEYSLQVMSPEIFLFVWALLVITFDLITKRKSGTAVGYMTMLGLALTGAFLFQAGYGRGFGMMFFNDPMAIFFKVIFLGAAFMAVGSTFGITEKRIVNHRGEFYGLILMSTVGMMFLASSQELLSLYIGLELTTIPLYVLVSFFKDDKKSVESGIKYLIVGALSSALLIYGISFLYGLSGTTEINQMTINIAITHIQNETLGVALLMPIMLLLAGIGFKLALPPFHQWAPDVYEGAPTPIAAFLSVGSKAAGIVAFSKIMVMGLEVFHSPVMAPNDWGMMVALMAAGAMVWGNIAAIRQTNIKRMLAFSSIAQAGYIMVGMLAMNEYGQSSVGFYMFVYMFANMGAFAIVTIVEDQTGSCEISTFSGLSKSSPFFSAAMAIFMLSLAGIPPLAGFFAKYYVFAAAIAHAGQNNTTGWLYWLVGIGLLTTVFALYYYANIIKVSYFGKEASPFKLKAPLPAVIIIVIGLLGVFGFGLYPEPIIDFASNLSDYFKR